MVDRCRSHPRGSCVPRPHNPKTARCGPSWPWLLFRALASRPGCKQPSLVGFIRVARPADRTTRRSPLHRLRFQASTPARRARRASALGVHSESLVPSVWFCTTSTASSAWRFAGLLHPAAGHEVRCVSCSHVPGTAAPDKRMMAGWSRCEIPAALLGPLEGFSPSTAVPRHRGRCLLAVGVPPAFRRPCHTVAGVAYVLGK